MSIIERHRSNTICDFFAVCQKKTPLLCTKNGPGASPPLRLPRKKDLKIAILTMAILPQAKAEPF
jgi:hypothetical protein